MKSRKLTILALCGLSVTPLYAGEEDPLRLGEILVTPSRTNETKFNSPYTATSVDQNDQLENQYRTTPQVLRDIPGVMLQETSPGQGSPYIRGFTGFRNLFLIDGVRLNNSVFREGPNQYWNTVDAFSIQKFEVIKGPSSVLWGSDAIGGTVNALTINPYAYGEMDGWAGHSHLRLASAEESVMVRQDISVAIDDFTGLVFGASYKDIGEIIGGDTIGTQPHTGYDEYDVDFKAERFLDDDLRLVLAHQQAHLNNVPRTHATVYAKSFDGTTVGSDRKRELDQDRDLTYLQIHGENRGGDIDAFHANVSWHQQDEMRDRITGGGSRRFEGFEVGTFGLWAQAETQYEQGRWTYGFEYYHDQISSSSTNNPIQGPVGDDATYDLFGIYTENENRLTELDRIILGVRYNYAHADINRIADPTGPGIISIDDDWESVAGSTRLVHEIEKNRLNLYGGVSQGFRAPNLSDLSRLDVARSGEIEVASPGLDPEYFTQFEVGLKAQDKDLSAELSYYYTDVKDMIVRTPTGVFIGPDAEVIKRNAGDGHIQGVEFGSAWHCIQNFTLFGNVAWMEGEIDTYPTSAPVLQREYIDRLQPLTGQLGLRWDHPDRKTWLEFVTVSADTADKLSTRDAGDTQRIPPGGTPSYTIFHVRGGWRLNDQTTLTLAVENLTNEDYRVHGSGTNSPGTNVIFGLDITY